MSSDLIELVKRLGEPRVLVVGDVMLDRYVWGDAERVSQEAPVILLRADRREERLGAAGSVATMLRALGARVAVAGVVGGDSEGTLAQKLLAEHGVDTAAIVTDGNRPTTLKERYLGRAQQRHPQQMMRVDYECREAIPEPVERGMIESLRGQMGDCDMVLISDYDKGVCTRTLLAWLIGECQARGLRIIADPMRGGDYRK